MNIRPVVNENGTISFFQIRDAEYGEVVNEVVFTLSQLEMTYKMMPLLIKDANKKCDSFFEKFSKE